MGQDRQGLDQPEVRQDELNFIPLPGRCHVQRPFFFPKSALFLHDILQTIRYILVNIIAIFINYVNRFTIIIVDFFVFSAFSPGFLDYFSHFE